MIPIDHGGGGRYQVSRLESFKVFDFAFETLKL
jgi:hypothetical protein